MSLMFTRWKDLFVLIHFLVHLKKTTQVEIVGDGYLVASGLPYPNGKQHAKEISNMALRLMKEVDGFRVRNWLNWLERLCNCFRWITWETTRCRWGWVFTLEAVLVEWLGLRCLISRFLATPLTLPHWWSQLLSLWGYKYLTQLWCVTNLYCKLTEIYSKELLEELGGFDCAVRGQMVVPRIGEVTSISVLDSD